MRLPSLPTRQSITIRRRAADASTSPSGGGRASPSPLTRAQGVDITIPITCSVFEPDPMTSQPSRDAPLLKFRHKIHELWVIFTSVAIALL